MATKTAARTCRTITADLPAAEARAAGITGTRPAESWAAEYAVRCADRIEKFVAACNRWFLVCDELIAARESGDPDRLARATAAHVKGRRPSEQAQGAAYDAAVQALGIVGIDHTTYRAGNVAGLAVAARLIRQAAAA